MDNHDVYRKIIRIIISKEIIMMVMMRTVMC